MARGHQAFGQSNEGLLTWRARVRAAWPYRLLAAFRPIRQGLRLGIHNLWPLPDGSLVGVARKVVLKCAPGQSWFRIVNRLRWGNKPGFKGLCVDPQGFVYYAEYARNLDRRLPMALHRSEDGGETYRIVHEFPAGRVRHIHFVQWDPFAHCLWMGTGDADHECSLLRSTDHGEHWDLVGGGSQLWRAVGVVFTSEALYWGSDAGSDAGTETNWIVRYDRHTARARKVQELQGPCHGSGRLKDGTLLVSTGVEGGRNERDAYIHLWSSRDGESWEELAKWQKDWLPKCVQFGVLHFPHGLETSQRVHFTTLGLSKAGEAHYIGEVQD